MSADHPTISRRKLLGGCAGVAMAAALPVQSAAADTTVGTSSCDDADYPGALLDKNRIGIQLYTIRDQITSIGFAKVLERLAKIGYNEVEFAGFSQGGVGPITVQQLRQLLDDNGLRAIGNHSGANAGNIQQKLDEAQTLGMPYVGIASAISSNGSTVAGWQANADAMNALGEASAARGIKFYWHNHSTEFNFASDAGATSATPRRIYDILLAETDPALVYFEMDIYWAFVGKYRYGRAPNPTFEPISYVTANKDRFPLFHVKDGTTRSDGLPIGSNNQLQQDGYSMCDVGQGDIDFATFFRTLGEKDRHSYLQEHDTPTSRPGGSWRCAAASYGWMRHGLVDPS